MNSLTDQDIVIAAKLRSGKKLSAAEMARLKFQREKEQRARWVPCSAPHISDIIRWTESVSSAAGQAAASRAAVPGRRTVTAQVMGRDAEKLTLCILAQEWLTAEPPAAPLHPGDQVRRKPSVICSGDCQRLAR